MTSPARQKFQLRRPQTEGERSLVKFALNSTVRGMISPALRRPMTRDNVYISNGKYVHYVLAQPKSFEPRSFKMNPEDKRGIRTVVASPKGTWDDVLEKPRSPQKLQSILVPKESFQKMSRSFSENPILMTVMNPGYKKNPVDVEYDPGSKHYRVYRTNPERTIYRCGECGYKTTRIKDFHTHQRKAGCRGPAIEESVYLRNPRASSQYGPSSAVTWKPTGVKVSGPRGNYIRYQKVSPKRFDPRSFRTISLGRRGTKAVIGCPKGKYDPRTKTCRVGTRVQAVLVPKSRHRGKAARTLRMARNPAIPLWNNPEFGTLPVDRESYGPNPMDIATGMMPIYNDNPKDDCRTGDCDNPSHDHNAFPVETAGLYDDNLRPTEVAGFQDNVPAHHFSYDDNLRPAEVAGFQDNTPLPGYYGATFDQNPGGFSVGDFVRNLKRVMKANEIELEKKTLGQIVSVGQFMGDTVYTVSFLTPDGAQKTFKFFAREIVKEPDQLKFQDNPFHYRPASPRRLQKFSHTENRYPKYGELSNLAKQPSSRPGNGSPGRSSSRVKIPIGKFEAWLSRSGSPDEKRRYAQAKTAYRRFHKGADPEYVTRRMVDVGAGKKTVARSFAYSMGKSPFEPYITPKGSGKGPHKAYLHEYEQMPEGVTVPGGKVVIKPLDGKTKITDWIHH